MRIKVIQKPTATSIDGLRLDRFEPGCLYDMGTTLGMMFLAEGWGEPVINEDPALLVPLRERIPSADVESATPNLIREKYQPYFDHRPAVAEDNHQRLKRRGIRK